MSVDSILLLFWLILGLTEAATGGVLQEKMSLEIFQSSQGNTYAFKKGSGTGVSYEFCKISKKTFLRTALNDRSDFFYAWKMSKILPNNI